MARRSRHFSSPVAAVVMPTVRDGLHGMSYGVSNVADRRAVSMMVVVTVFAVGGVVVAAPKI